MDSLALDEILRCLEIVSQPAAVFYRVQSLQGMFTVCKKKVWGFLRWLKNHNIFYRDVPLQQDLMDMYPEEDVLPGLLESIILNSVDDPDAILRNEDAGPQEHPSDVFLTFALSTSAPYMEKMGMSDPEGDKIPARTYTASALRNITSKLENSGAVEGLPDLIVHYGPAVPEYDNPKLLPGMFLTLFPFGIHGFDDHSRTTLLSFQSQADYCFDIDDKSFRYHNCFMFVIFNIIQGRMAHLHTYFSVKRRHFDTVASSLVGVSADLLKLVALHLQQELPHSFRVTKDCI